MIEIKRNISHFIFSAGQVLLFLNVGLLAFAGDERDQDHLIKTVKSFESRFENFSVDVTTTKWLGEHQEHFSSSEVRRVIQWGDRFYESGFSRDAAHKLSELVSRFSSRLTNAQVSIASSAFDNFEIHSRDCRPPTQFQPYAQLLMTLGFEGTLSTFLELGRGNLDTMNVEIGETEDFQSLATQRIRGVFQLPGSSKVKSIDLRLAIDHAYLPCWGQYTDTVEGQVLHRIETQVKVFAEHDDDDRTYVREMSSSTVVAASLLSSDFPSVSETTISSDAAEAKVQSEALKPLASQHSSMLIECDGKFLSSESLESLDQMGRSADEAVTKIVPNQKQQSENSSNAQTIRRVNRPSYVNWIILDGIVLGLIGISMNPKIWVKA